MLNMRLAFLLILLHGQSWKFIECFPPTDCGSLLDCVHESQNAVCALDLELLCFKYFDSFCHLAYDECENQKEYSVYVHEYCENSAFMCNT